MARVRSSPDGPSNLDRLWAVAPVVATAGIAVLTAVISVPAPARTPVAVGGAAVVAAVAVAAGRASSRLRLDEFRNRRQAELAAELRAGLAEQDRQTVRLAEVVLPQAMRRLDQGETVDEAMDAVVAGDGLLPALHPAHLVILRSVLDAVKAEEDLRDSAQRAFVNIARRVQAIVHQEFQDLREMEERHGRDSEVFADLLKLDHGTALIGRLADSIAVLGGSRPGRQWQKNVPLYSVLRGAVSRISDYRRVDLHSVAEIAVTGPAVEPLIHALAELLDNATRYSPPHTRVHLTAIEVQNGVAVEIEDAGVGLSEEARVRAERVFSQVSAGLDLADLGETPRLGLSVVGRLAQANGFQVALRPSAYAGVRAVLVVPHELLSTIVAPAGWIPGAGVIGAGLQTPTLSEPLPIPEARAGDHEATATARGLPQRKRRAPIAAPADSPAPMTTSAPMTHSASASATATASPSASTSAAPQQFDAPVPPGLWLSAFQGPDPEPHSGSARTAGDDPSTEEGEPA